MRFLIFIIITSSLFNTSCAILSSPPVTCIIGSLAAECLKDAKREIKYSRHAY